MSRLKEPQNVREQLEQLREQHRKKGPAVWLERAYWKGTPLDLEQFKSGPVIRTLRRAIDGVGKLAIVAIFGSIVSTAIAVIALVVSVVKS